MISALNRAATFEPEVLRKHKLGADEARNIAIEIFPAIVE